jgi:hypothetical protein
MEGGAVGHNFERDPPKDHLCQIWFSCFRGEDLNVKVYNVNNLYPYIWTQLVLVSFDQQQKKTLLGIIQ